jgi:pimeloyl-ACP methyl ester carboxylesterase
VLLIHGFGANSRHWRHTLPALSDGAQVVALDLLGFGASDKPPSCLDGETPRPGAVRYGFDLWAAQVVDVISNLLQPAAEATEPASSSSETAARPQRRLHLVGNSIGGMVALRAAGLLQEQQTLERLPQPAVLEQLVLIDCAQRRLDDKRLAEAPPLAQLGRPALKQLVRQRWLVGSLFRWLARPAVIRRVLQQAYPSGANVDDELVELLYRPSTEAGALESFRGFVNLFNDALAPQLLEQLSEAARVPVRLIWGAADPWEDPAEARHWAERFRCIQALEVLPGVGHCPHDEAPELVNPILRRWILATD